MSSRYWSLEECCWVDYEPPSQVAVPAPAEPVEEPQPEPISR